tara:strand:+ start:330 stop:638 length:309 start_codon:yes stop_codon:yes gene_type:complete
MSTSTAVTKKKVLVETKVVIEPGWIPSWANEGKAKLDYLTRWADDFMKFVRDHRSQDVNAVFAEPVYETQCSGCGREWEEMVDDETGSTCCAYCGIEMEVVK